MTIEFDKFLQWAERKFGDVVVSGNEIKINSIFCEDFKHHLWCNPYGGKKGYEGGVYHCWKTDAHGSLISLVMKVESCTYDEALEILGAVDISMHVLEKKIEEFFSKRTAPTPLPNTLQLPDHTYHLSLLPEANPYRGAAEAYLLSRRLQPNNFLVCIEGDYHNRIIIPYYDKNRNLIYYNARWLGKSDKVAKYMGPPKECGVGKSDVLYWTSFPKPGSKIYLTEGEFDAECIAEAGLPAAAFGGKAISDKQAMMLVEYKPVLCLDNDKAGKAALTNIAKLLIHRGFGVISYVRPASAFKDWNEMAIHFGTNILKAFITSQEKVYGSDENIGLRG